MLNNNLKTLRKQKGYTQEELAARLHVSRQTISKWENGISAPDADTLIRMAELFQVTVEELLGAVFGFVNYHAVLNDTILSPETAAMVLSSSTSVVVKGAVRAAAGLLIVLISVLMNRKYK